MVKNRLRINDSITECIIFRSTHLKQNLSDLSITVWDTQILSFSKVRHVGLVFDQYLIFRYSHFGNLLILICETWEELGTI